MKSRPASSAEQLSEWKRLFGNILDKVGYQPREFIRPLDRSSQQKGRHK